MKIKFNAIAAAAVLAAVSASASATIQTGAQPDFLFVAFDGVGDTYVRDLGAVTESQLANSISYTAPSTLFSTTFAGHTDIQWNVIALNASSTPSVYVTGDINNLAGLVHNDLLTIASIELGPLGGITQLDVAANGYIKGNGEYTGSKTSLDVTNAFMLSSTLSFGLPTSGQGVGASQNLLKVDSNGTASQLYVNASLAAFDNNEAGGYFTLTDAQGDLTWTNASVAQTPLPAALALFVPGLLGMFGLGRRAKKAA